MKRAAWIVIADSDRARILKVQQLGILIQVDCLHDPLGRFKEQDLTSDLSGKGHSKAMTSRHMEPTTYPHQKELLAFAKRLSSYLEKARQAKAYMNLYLAAEPRLLGILRQQLCPATKEILKGEFAKNLANEPLEMIWQQLPLVV
jgi:protein required for attachment to host cells